eukprot:163245_1
MTSWYISNGCIEIESLTPGWIYIVGMFIQVFYSLYSMQSDGACCDYKWVKKVMRVYIPVQLVYYTIFDIIHWIDWMLNNDASGWDNFLCGGCIIFTSPAWKTCWVTLILYPFYHDDWDDTKAITCGACVVYFIVICPWFVSITLVAWFVIAWIYIIIMLCLCGCAYASGKFHLIIVIPFVIFTFIMFLAGMIMSLGMVNVYQGLDYWEYGFVHVLKEMPDDNVYFNHVIGEFVHFMRFFGWMT